MATKRMISLTVVDTDAFLELPLSTQALYFHLNLRADDDGFVGNPKRICRTVGASEDDLEQLKAKNFIIGFDDGVIVIKHWRIHNTLSANRYKGTNYIEDKALLKVKSNKAYTLGEGLTLDDDLLLKKSKRQTKDEQKTSKRQTKDEQETNTDKTRLDKTRLDKPSIEETRLIPTRDEILTYVFANDLNVDVDHFIDYYEANDWMSNGEKIRNWKALIRKWSVNEERPKQDNALNLIDQIVKGVKV